AGGWGIVGGGARVGIDGSSLEPQVTQATGDVLWGGEHKERGSSTSAVAFSAGLRASWELDFWGKFQRSIEAADAGYWASIALYDDVQVLMASQVASLYISIRTTKVRLRIAAENAALQKRNLDISERLFKSGHDSELDVQQAKTQY